MKLTEQQKQVLNILQTTQAPLSAYNLLDQVRQYGITAPVQIYRILEKLIKEGYVHRLATMNSYISCTHQHQHDLSILTICDDCGHVDEIVDSELNQQLSQNIHKHQFSVKNEHIEIHGKCNNCEKE